MTTTGFSKCVYACKNLALYCKMLHQPLTFLSNNPSGMRFINYEMCVMILRNNNQFLQRAKISIHTEYRFCNDKNGTACMCQFLYQIIHVIVHKSKCCCKR